MSIRTTTQARAGLRETPSIFEEPTPSCGPPRELALLVEGRIRPIKKTGWLKVGTERRANIRLQERHISSRHAFIRRSGDSVEVIDNQSTNGVWWRGQRRTEVRVSVDDVFFLGSVPALVVEVGISRRYRHAFRWCGMILTPSSIPLIERIARMATMCDPVTIIGESGTGKERVARAIHAASNRAEGPFVAVNCATLPDNLAEGELFGVQRGAFTGADRSRPGLFERATGGTLFLDEIAELSPAVQSKLLRVLETQVITPLGGTTTRTVNVRIVAATWQDIADSQNFRHDLMQRLSVLPLLLSPLRTRPDAIGPLLELFLRERNALHYWPSDALIKEMLAASWTGNVRELRSRVIRCACTGNMQELLPNHAMTSIHSLPRRGSALTCLTDERIRRSLVTHRGNRSATAKDLGISRSTLYRRLQRSG